MSDKKGGYRLVSLKLIELSTMTACAGLYQAIESSHDKPLCLCDILVSGAKKNNVYITAIKGTNKYTLKNVYGYDIEVTNADAVEVSENADGIELPKPTPEDDGSLVGVNVQGKYVLKPNPLGEATQADNGKVLEVIAGAWAKGGKKVNVIDAPASTTLDDDTIEKIKEGVFINGEFLDFKNPMFFPSNTGEYGVVIGPRRSNNNVIFGEYSINPSTKVISVTSAYFECTYFGKMNITSVANINDKAVPAYPSNTGTFTLKCVDGVLTWVQDQ